MKPYLIQRAKFQYDSQQNGIDSILEFDYMGSAEFEFGALSESLNRIREHISEYRMSTAVGTSLSHPSKSNSLNDLKITIFCNSKNYKDVCQAVEGIADNKFHLKVYCDFSDWIHNKKSHRNSDFWWDIKNDFMFWKCNPEFNNKFEKLIMKGKAK